MFLNSHDKVTYNLMVTKREGPWAASLRSRHAISHDKAVLHPRRHQTVSSSEQESMAYASDEHCTSSRVAPQPLTQYPNQEASASSMFWPLLDAPEDQHLIISSLSAAARDKGWGQAPSHPPIPSVSAALLHFPPVWDYWGSWEMQGREGKAAVRKEVQKIKEKRVSPSLAIPCYKSIQKVMSPSLSFLPPPFPTNPSHLRSTWLVRENGAGREGGQGERGSRYHTLTQKPQHYHAAV